MASFCKLGILGNLHVFRFAKCNVFWARNTCVSAKVFASWTYWEKWKVFLAKNTSVSAKVGRKTSWPCRLYRNCCTQNESSICVYICIHLHQSVTNIFEYSNIRIYWSRIYIRTFVRINFSFTNIFGHSFVSNLFVRIYSDIRW